MKIYFDLRGILSTPTNSTLRMAGMVRVNLEWACQLNEQKNISFVAPGVHQSVRIALQSAPEWKWLADRMEGSTNRLIDDLCCDFLTGRWKCAKIRSRVAPWFARFKFPADIGRFVKRRPKPPSPSIYFVPSVKKLPDFFPSGVIPVMNVYDIIPLLFSEGNVVGDFYYREAIETIRNQGGHFIVNSKYVRHSLISMFAISLENIHIVPLGTTPIKEAQSTNQPSDFNLPYFLHVSGDCQRRKNVEGTIRGFCKFLEITGENHELRIVGPSPQQLESLILKNAGKWKDRIIGMGHVTDEALNSLFSNAYCGLYLSLHEGFGLPPLECMKYGVPMICANTTSIPEIVGEAALLVDPFDDEEIALAMNRVVKDSELAKRLSKDGIQRAAEYNWIRSGNILMETFEKIIDFSETEIEVKN